MFPVLKQYQIRRGVWTARIPRDTNQCNAAPRKELAMNGPKDNPPPEARPPQPPHRGAESPAPHPGAESPGDPDNRPKPATDPPPSSPEPSPNLPRPLHD